MIFIVYIFIEKYMYFVLLIALSEYVSWFELINMSNILFLIFFL